MDGFGLAQDEELLLVDKIGYKGKDVEAAWALGDAIHVLDTTEEDAPPISSTDAPAAAEENGGEGDSTAEAEAPAEEADAPAEETGASDEEGPAEEASE